MITDIRNLIAARRDEENDEGGFTLIELLIVIVVLGILAAIVVFAVQNLTKSSATSACRSDAKTVETGVEAYKAQVGTYPTTGAPMLTATTLVASGPTVGPWLRSFPAANEHYIIGLGTAAAGTADPAVPTTAAPATSTSHGVDKYAVGKVLVAKANAPTVFLNSNTPVACNDLP